jgi:hypothetical protein
MGLLCWGCSKRDSSDSARPQEPPPGTPIDVPTEELVLLEDVDELPEPPEGFEWCEISEVKAVILKPVEWHFSKLVEQDTASFYITKEDTSGGKGFLTGLTLETIRNVPEKKGDAPSLYAVQYIDEFAQGGYVLGEPRDKNFGPFKARDCEVIKRRKHADEEILTHIRVSTCANDSTGTLFILRFASPEKEWPDNSKTGQKMIDNTFFHDEI